MTLLLVELRSIDRTLRPWDQRLPPDAGNRPFLIDIVPVHFALPVRNTAVVA
jgi:hypothetical protein